MKKINLSSCVILLLLPILSISQQPTVAPAHLPGDRTISNIVGLAQDNNGFIWIADNNLGLFKYDGNQLISYKPGASNVNSLTTSRLECLYADTKGNIWIGTFEKGLYRFDPETEIFTHFEHSNSDPLSLCSDSIRAIVEDNDGRLWVGTTNGLDRLDTKTGEFTHTVNKSADGISLSHEHVRILYKDKAGTIWVGCGSPFREEEPKPSQGGLYRLDKATGKVIHYLPIEKDPTSLIDNTVRAIFEDSRGVFWVGTAGDGLHIMDREKGSFLRCLYDPRNPNKLSRPAVTYTYSYARDHITFINEDIQGCIWIGTFTGGINRYNPATNTMEHYGTGEKEPYKIARDEFWTFVKTKDNLMWTSIWQPASNDQGLYKISTTSNKLNYSHTGRLTITFAEDADSSLWFGTREGLLRLNKKNGYDSFFLDANKVGLSNLITHLEHDAANNLWVSTFNGLHYFNKTTRLFTSYRHDNKNSNSLSSDTVITTQLIEDGTILIGTEGGLDLMDIKTGIFKHYKNNPLGATDTRNNQIWDIKRDKTGNIWVGTQLGLVRFDRNAGKFFATSVDKTFINSIFQDSRDRLWIGTLNYGLFLYNPKTGNFSHFNDSTGIISNNITVFGITEDKEHSLWLNSSLGFIELYPETKSAVQFGKSWNINPEALTSQGFTSSQGEIFFGDTAGYFHFRPQDFEIGRKILPQPFINKFFVSNKQLIPGIDKVLPYPLSETRNIKLSHHQNNFSIEFNSIDFVNSESDKNILYKLENYDDAWRKNSGENKAYYYDVPPGKYVFLVKSANIYGKWGERSLTIIITPPWYKTLWAYILFALLAIGILRAYIVYRSRKLQREKKMLEEKVTLRTKQLQESIEDLKTTQSQLIQSEKMASLGELTAGIAHEIQNPLNFVNNFSEVNKELIDEASLANESGKSNEVKELLSSLKDNEEKIIHHGKRADAIVKGMLQHSRSSSGQKEQTDLNALTEEYLRLSYHGFRAKDKMFNATLTTNFDSEIGKINIIPQDIGRVILNLYNNAFYAVNEKKKQRPQGYEPTVSVSTKKVGDKVLINIKDNGNGIPQKVREKIFQPFFTTKPTGQGTGLGLSLSYDIAKAHGGELKVETKEGESSEFIIELPLA